MINKLSKWTARLVFLLTVLSLALSYQALMEVAANNGLAGWRSIVWPLLIDGALIVFSLAVVVAVLTSAKPWLRWGMVALFTILTILFNLADVDNLPDNITVILPFLVAVIPPVALFMSFETLMSIVRQGAKRQDILTGIGELSEQRQELWQELDSLKTSRDRFKAQIDKKQIQLSELDSELSEVSEQVTVLKTGTVIKLTKRQQEVAAKLEAGEDVTIPAIQEMYNVSERTAYRIMEPFNNGK